MVSTLLAAIDGGDTGGGVMSDADGIGAGAARPISAGRGNWALVSPPPPPPPPASGTNTSAPAVSACGGSERFDTRAAMSVISAKSAACAATDALVLPHHRPSM